MNDKYYVVEITRNDEFHTGPFSTPQEAVKAANKAWDHLTESEKKKNTVEVRQYVADIEADDCTDFDYNTVEWRPKALAAELREMASLGWEKPEATGEKEEFLKRVGEVGKGFTEEEIFQAWEDVWTQIYDEMTHGVPYWLDFGNEIGAKMTLYRKTFDGDEEVWSGYLEEAGITDNDDPSGQAKLDDFFEKKFGIKSHEWEIG